MMTAKELDDITERQVVGLNVMQTLLGRIDNDMLAIYLDDISAVIAALRDNGRLVEQVRNSVSTLPPDFPEGEISSVLDNTSLAPLSGGAAVLALMACGSGCWHLITMMNASYHTRKAASEALMRLFMRTETGMFL